MRTILMIAVGLVLMLLFMGVARLVVYNKVRAYKAAFLLFAAVWLCVAAVNMWLGVTEAGYSYREELPIFALIVLVPVATAYFVHRKMRSGVDVTAR